MLYEFLVKEGVYANEEDSSEFYFSLCSLKDIRSLKSIRLNQEIVNNVLNLLTVNSILEINLEDFKLIQEVYHISYREYIMIIAVLLERKDLDKNLELKNKLEFSKRIGSKFFINMKGNY